MNPKKRVCLFATTLFVLTLPGLSLAAGGTYYRWVDASGTTMNSDRPPPTGVDYEVISTKTNHMYQEAPEDNPDATAADSNGGQTAAANNASGQPKFEKDPEYCASARQNLETLNTSARIRVHDADGGFRFINEEEKEAQRTTAEAIIDQHCE